MNDSRPDPYLHEYFRRFRSTPRQPDEPRSIVFVVGSTGISGGTYVILQHALHLRQRGWRVAVAAMHRDDGALPWHPALEQVDVMSIEDAADFEFDIAIATWWRTVFELPKLRFRHVMYLVQSVESRFYGEDPDSAWAQPVAEMTYSLGLPTITIATWLQVYLSYRYGASAFLVRNGIRKDLYSPVGPTVEPPRTAGLRVLVEGPLGVPMKNVANAIRLAREGGADEVWLMTGFDDGTPPPVDRVFTRVPVESTPLIFRSCDVLVKLSQVEGMFGPPLEMFHCGGTAITYDVTGFEEYIVDGENGLVAPMGDEEAVVAAVRSLKGDRDLLRRLRLGALDTAARWPSWRESSLEFERVVSAVSRQPAVSHAHLLFAIRGAAQDLR